MGKSDLKQQKMMMALKMVGGNNPYVNHGAFLFKIPVTDDHKAQIEILAKQVYDWLIYFTERTGKYQDAINIVQKWLRLFIKHDPTRKPWVSEGAEAGGNKFLEVVKNSRKANGKSTVLKVDLAGLFKQGFSNGPIT